MAAGTLTLNRTLNETWTTRERLEKSLAGMREVRRPGEQEIFEIASLAQPNRTRYVMAFGNSGRGVKQRANKLYDGHAIRSFRYLSAGMYTGMSSPNRPWFEYGIADKDLQKYQPVKIWLSEVTKIVRQMLGGSNFYGAAKIGYSEISLFGTDACIMDEEYDWETGQAYPVCYPLTFGEYWIGLNHKLEPDRLIRQVNMTVRQIVKKFVADRHDPRQLNWNKVSIAVRNLWDNCNYESEVPVFHAIEPNDLWIPGRLDDKGKPWRSIKWEAGQGDRNTLLEEAGYHSQPFWAPRWEVKSSDVYGYGPGHDALTDIRVLQLQGKRKGEATDYAVKPPLLSPSNLRIKMQPGAVTYASQADMAAVKEVWKVDYRALTEIRNDQLDLRDVIDEATYARLFMLMSRLSESSAERTVPEIVAREEEKMTQLGPVIERVNDEKLTVSCDRAFDIAARNEMLPPPPPEMEGMPLELGFTSILAQAQKMIGLQQTDRATGFVGQVNAAFPGSGAGDNIDTDKLVSDYWERSGAPPEALRDPRDREKIRVQRSQAERAQAAAAQMPDLKAGAEGVKALAETPVQGGAASFFDKIINAS